MARSAITRPRMTRGTPKLPAPSLHKSSNGSASPALNPSQDHTHHPRFAHLSCTTRALTDLATGREPPGLPGCRGDHTYAPSSGHGRRGGPHFRLRGRVARPVDLVGIHGRGAGVTPVLAGGPRFPWLSPAHRRRPHPAAARHPAAGPAGPRRRVARPSETWPPLPARPHAPPPVLARAPARLAPRSAV